jgi:alkylation response protein AidB-like acyl-CoA dehydrogenase
MDSVQNVINQIKDLSARDKSLRAAAFLSSDAEEMMNVRAIAALNSINLSHYYIPKELGGKFDNALNFMLIHRYLYSLDPSLALGYGLTTFMASLCIWYLGTNEQKKTLVDIVKEGNPVSVLYNEEGAGNDVGMMTARVDGYGNELRVYGVKWVSNNIRIAPAFVVYLKTPAMGISKDYSLAFIKKNNEFECAVKYLEKIKTHGVRSCEVAGIKFDGLKISHNDFIGKMGSGLEITLKTFQITRTTLPGIALGGLDTVLRLLVNDNGLMCGHEGSYFRKVLLDAYLDLLMCDSVCNASARMLHVCTEKMSLYSSVVKYFVPTIISKSINELFEVFSEQFHVSSERKNMLVKLKRDIPVLSVGHAGSSTCLSSIASQLPLIARYNSLNKIESATGKFIDGGSRIFNIAEELPPLEFSRFKVTCHGKEYLLSGLEDIMNLIDGGRINNMPSENLGALRRYIYICLHRARKLFDKVNALVKQSNLNGTEMYEHAITYSRLTAALLCFGAWYYNRDKNPGAFQQGDVLLLIFSRILIIKHIPHDGLQERVIDELVKGAGEGRLFSMLNLNI